MRFLVLQHIGCEGPGELGNFMQTAGVPFDIVKLDHGEIIADLLQYQALLVMGGPMNVYEENKYPFLKEEDALIKEAVKLNMPFLGICLGAQLLAKALGARVRANYTKEVGFMNVYLTDYAREDRIFHNLGKSLPVFQWHGDTFEMPEGAVRLATAPTCQNQAFRHGNLYGLQFHLEVTPDMVKEWTLEYSAELETLGESVRQKVLPTDLSWRAANLKIAARMLFNNFLEVVKNPVGKRQ